MSKRDDANAHILYAKRVAVDVIEFRRHPLPWGVLSLARAVELLAMALIELGLAKEDEDD